MYPNEIMIFNKLIHLFYRAMFAVLQEPIIHFRGLFFTQHLAKIVLNEVFVNFTRLNLRYLLKVSNFLIKFNFNQSINLIDNNVSATVKHIFKKVANKQLLY